MITGSNLRCSMVGIGKDWMSSGGGDEVTPAYRVPVKAKNVARPTVEQRTLQGAMVRQAKHIKDQYLMHGQEILMNSENTKTKTRSRCSGRHQ